MRVLFVSHVPGLYGAGRTIYDLVSTLHDRGDIEPYVILPGEGPLQDLLEEQGVQVSISDVPWWCEEDASARSKVSRWARVPGSTLDVAGKIKEYNIDLVQTTTCVTPVGGLAAALTNRPHIWRVREFAEEDYGLSFDFGFGKTAQIMDRLSDRIVPVSGAVAEKFHEQLGDEKVESVYNGIKVNRPDGESRGFEHPPQASYLLAVIGLIHPAKGQREAIEALAKLRSEQVDAELIVAGSGDDGYISDLKELAARLGVKEHVAFPGFVDAALELMRQSDIVLVCSRSEAFGRVCLESMMSGTPVVAARSGGTPEQINHGETGLLYTPGNPDDLAEKISWLLEDEELRVHIAKEAQAHARSAFSVTAYAESMEAVYSSVNGA